MATRWIVDLSSVSDANGTATVDIDLFNNDSPNVSQGSINAGDDIPTFILLYLQPWYEIQMFEPPFGPAEWFLIESIWGASDFPETTWGATTADQFAGAGDTAGGTFDLPLVVVPADVEMLAAAETSGSCYLETLDVWRLECRVDVGISASGSLFQHRPGMVASEATSASLETATSWRLGMRAIEATSASAWISLGFGTGVQSAIAEILQLWGIQKWSHASCAQRAGAISILNQALQELWLRAKDRPYFTRATRRMLLDRGWRTDWFDIQSVEGLAVNLAGETLQPASNRREGEMFARMFLGELEESGDPTAYLVEYNGDNTGSDRTRVRLRMLPGSPAATLTAASWTLDVTDFVDNSGDALADVYVWADGGIATTIAASAGFVSALELILGGAYLVVAVSAPSPFSYVVTISQGSRGAEEFPAFGGTVTSGNFIGIGASLLAFEPTALVEAVDTAGPIISADIHTMAPRIALEDYCANTRLPVPVQYVETLLLPLARYMAAQSYHFNAKDQLPVLQERYQSSRHLFDTAEPSPKGAERGRVPHAGTTVQTSVTQTLP